MAAMQRAWSSAGTCVRCRASAAISSRTAMTPPPRPPHRPAVPCRARGGAGCLGRRERTGWARAGVRHRRRGMHQRGCGAAGGRGTCVDVPNAATPVAVSVAEFGNSVGVLDQAGYSLRTWGPGSYGLHGQTCATSGAVVGDAEPSGDVLHSVGSTGENNDWGCSSVASVGPPTHIEVIALTAVCCETLVANFEAGGHRRCAEGGAAPRRPVDLVAARRRRLGRHAVGPCRG